MKGLCLSSICGVVVSLLLWPGSSVLAASQVSEVEDLRRELERTQREVEALTSKMQELQERLRQVEATKVKPPRHSAVDEKGARDPASALEEALKQVEEEPSPEQPPPPAIWSRQAGGTTYRLIDLSLDILFAAGTSTEDDAGLKALQGGEHDPRQRGFTLQNVELSLVGAVDPYLTGEAHLIYFLDPEGESRFELEEAFLTTTSFPYGLQLEAGQFFTEFGRINPQHPHQWHWQDQPVIHNRLFGPDGIRQVGLRLGWLTPLPWFSELHVGVQHPRGETMVSFLANNEVFEERPLGGRPFVRRDIDGLDDLVYLVRWNNSWDLSPEVTTLLGGSALFGPNATGEDARTYIYGADLLVKWRPTNNFRGWPFLKWESEFLKRDYNADETIDFPEETLRDWGFYTQLLYGFSYRWAAGLRYEFAAGSGRSVEDGKFISRDEDPFRSDRYRISPLLVYHPTEFSRLRLQYNYDNTDHLDDHGHSVWLGGEILFGAHPGHKY